MKYVQRRATTAVALTLFVLGAPTMLHAQRRGANPNAKRLLVAVFESNNLAAGVAVTDAIRSRLRTANPRELAVIDKDVIDGNLKQSGFRSDSALGVNQMRELGRLLRADEILWGRVTRSAGGFRVEPRLMLPREPAGGYAQPLAVVENSSAGDIAKEVERAVLEARKQLPKNQECENHIRDNKPDAAIAAAHQGIAAYPSATIARLCLASAYAAKEQPDSVLRVTDEIRRLDPKNTMALRIAVPAYRKKGDQEGAVRALVALMALEPNNITLQNDVVESLGALGKPEIALPIIDTLLARNPGDPKMLRSRWLMLSLAASQVAAADTAARVRAFTDALLAGEAMVKADSTLADSAYYDRQFAAATISSPERGIEYAAIITQKYPNRAEAWFNKAVTERKAGQLQAARQSIARVLAIDPKYPNASLMVAQIFIDQRMTDSLVPLVRRAIAAGEDPKVWAPMLIQPAAAAVSAAQADSVNKTANFERALALAQESDKLAPSAFAKFYIGVSSFFLGVDASTAADKPKSCDLAKKAQDLFLLTQTNLPAGGSVDAGTASQLLGYAAQYAERAEQQVKVYCK